MVTDRGLRRPLRRCLAALRPLLVEGRAGAEPGLLLTADHPGLLDGPVLALVVERPLLFGVDPEYARDRAWRALLKAYARLTGHDFVALSPRDAFGLRALGRRLEAGGAVCLFPEGGIRRGGPPRPWRPGACWLARRARSWQHVRLEGTEGGLFSSDPLRLVFAPPRSPTLLAAHAAQAGEGSGWVPSSRGSKSSTATTSSTRS